MDELAVAIAIAHPGMRGHTRRNLSRCGNFYGAFEGDGKVSALVTQLPWTHYLLLLGQTRSPEETH